jgi:hypothetical protein
LNVQEKSANERFVFDGKTNSVFVPSTTVKQVVPEKFSFSFSMKHAAGTKDEQKEKQNILCETDDFSGFFIPSFIYLFYIVKKHQKNNCLILSIQQFEAQCIVIIN